ncbi:sphingomyelin phosphodiesterase-like protein [Leptotrombidium deliense]|uniref:Sphingomyelin phosphodiesterase n=1 Tax=Leptotrombidium deliense TaxID=299467 RepID=A0A443S8K2_9ACAR|nr:sphingomyelin phosphodiesterase-like protein [Leptotrombidium deliense]
MKLHLLFTLCWLILIIHLVNCKKDDFLSSFDLFYKFTKNLDQKQPKDVGLICTACRISISTLKSYSKNEKKFMRAVSNVCILLKLGTKTNCKGYANLFVPHVAYILRNSNLTTNEMCGVLIGKKCSKTAPSVYETWTVELPEPKKQVNFTGDMSALQILHLTDLHYDPLYKEGSLTSCDEKLCCRESSVNGKGKAGYWGHPPNCDAPLHLLENLVQHINTTHAEDFDLLFWTGDNSPHDSWMTTVDSIMETSTTITDLLKKYLSKNKVVFPILGNHEGMPTNLFSVSNDTKFHTKLIYEKLAEQWSEWLVTNEAINTFKFGGYYAKKFGTNFKVIALNTNICDRTNFWNLYAPIDPYNQLHWMVNELQKSEENGENVYVVAHIAPDPSCTPIWFHNYLRITERFRNTIKGFFYGHTHRDEFKVYYSRENETLHVGYIGPSVTNYNPGYRFYSLTKDVGISSGSVENMHSYYLNLTEANEKGKQEQLNWRKLYDAKRDYGLKSLSPQEWDLFYKRLLANDTLTQMYYANVIRHSNAFPKFCNDTCKHGIFGLHFGFSFVNITPYFD